jgi:hypothetical protein
MFEGLPGLAFKFFTLDEKGCRRRRRWGWRDALIGTVPQGTPVARSGSRSRGRPEDALATFRPGPIGGATKDLSTYATRVTISPPVRTPPMAPAGLGT